MPDTYDHEGHRYNGPIVAKHVNKDLEDWLTVLRIDGVVEILNAEQQAEEIEESKDCRSADRHDNTYRRHLCCVAGFLGEVSGCVESCEIISPMLLEPRNRYYL